MSRAPNALEVDPVYCWQGHVNEVARLQRAVFMQAPLRVAHSPKSIVLESLDSLVFFHVQNESLPPLPLEFWEYFDSCVKPVCIVSLRKPKCVR